MNTYTVSMKDYRTKTVEAFSKLEAVKIFKEDLLAWGIPVEGKATVILNKKTY